MKKRYKYKLVKVRVKKKPKKKPLRWVPAKEVKDLNPEYKNKPLPSSPKPIKKKKGFSGAAYLKAIGNPYSVKLK